MRNDDDTWNGSESPHEGGGDGRETICDSITSKGGIPTAKRRCVESNGLLAEWIIIIIHDRFNWQNQQIQISQRLIEIEVEFVIQWIRSGIFVMKPINIDMERKKHLMIESVFKREGKEKEI